MLLSLEPSGLIIAIVLWIIVSGCDYYLMLRSNQLRPRHHKASDGSVGKSEADPDVQWNRNSKQRAQNQFVFRLLLYIAWLILLWAGARAIGSLDLFYFAVGFVLLRALPILNEWQRTVSLFTLLRNPGSYAGFPIYVRWVNYKVASNTARAWLVGYAVLFLLTGNWLFIGGVAGMFTIWLNFGQTADALRKKEPVLKTKPVSSAVVNGDSAGSTTTSATVPDKN